EDVRALDRIVISGKHEARLDQPVRFGLELLEELEEERGIRVLEIEAAPFDLGLEEEIGPRPVLGPAEIHDPIDTLEIARDPLDAVGDLRGDGLEVVSARLLEVGELRDLLAVEPHFPAEPPGSERRRLPVVLDESHGMLREIDSQVAQTVEIDIEH